MVLSKNIPDEPEETLGGDVLLLLKLVDDEVLEGLGEGRGSELPVTDFLLGLLAQVPCM